MVPLAAPPTTATTALSVSERRIVGMLALVQFVNVLDFMMVMPLGPDARPGSRRRDLEARTGWWQLYGGRGRQRLGLGVFYRPRSAKKP